MMPKYKVMIVDDEPRVVNHLRDLIQADPECEVVLATTNPDEAIVYEGEHRVDLAIVDIEMGPHNGMDLIRNFSADTYSMVCTSHKDLGDPSLFAGAMDFFTKPFEADRLYFSLARFKENRGVAQQYWRDNPAPREIIVPLEGTAGLERIGLTDVVCFYCDCNKTKLILRDGATREIDKSMQQLELMLHVHGFIRIHRAYIANMQFAPVFHRTKRPKLVFSVNLGIKLHGCLENQLPIGRRYRANVAHYFSDDTR